LFRAILTPAPLQYQPAAVFEILASSRRSK
jgi:hypothetical protein